MDADSSQAATALLTEHLQYTPLSLIDDIIDSVNNFVYQGVGSLETGLLSTPPERLGFKASKAGDDAVEQGVDFPQAKQEIEEGLHKLETLLNSTIDKNFDKLEIYVLRNILSVPSDLVDWIRLSHYEGITHPPPENVPSAEAIQQLRQKLAASRRVTRALTSEYRRNEAVLNQLKSMLNPKSEDASVPNVSSLSGGLAQQPFTGHQPLTTNTKFALSQLPALKSSVADLRTKLATLKDVQLGMDSAKDELKEERRQYIEQRTKSHLERTGQPSIVESGPLSGKQTEIAEVEALEKAAIMFNPP